MYMLYPSSPIWFWFSKQCRPRKIYEFNSAWHSLYNGSTRLILEDQPQCMTLCIILLKINPCSHEELLCNLYPSRPYLHLQQLRITHFILNSIVHKISRFKYLSYEWRNIFSHYNDTLSQFIYNVKTRCNHSLVCVFDK